MKCRRPRRSLGSIASLRMARVGDACRTGEARAWAVRRRHPRACAITCPDAGDDLGPFAVINDNLAPRTISWEVLHVTSIELVHGSRTCGPEKLLIVRREGNLAATRIHSAKVKDYKEADTVVNLASLSNPGDEARRVANASTEKL